MRTLGTLAIAVTLSAGSVAAQAAPQITDSAGVRVVVNPEPRPNGPAFRLSVRPRVSIGQVEGAPEYQLFRATQGTLLADGTIVVSNTGTQELRFYDRTGKYLRSAGRKGQGPGEFATLSLVGTLAADSLLISDFQLKRYSVFDRAGKFVRSFPAPTELGPITYANAGVLRDGRLVAFRGAAGPEPEASSRLRKPVTLYFVSRDGAIAGALGEFPGVEMATGGRANRMAGTAVVFGRKIHAKARGDRIAVANDDAYSIRIHDASGKLLYLIRQNRAPVPVRPGDFERALPGPLRGGATPDNPLAQSLRAILDDMYKHTTMPAFGGTGSETSSFRFDPSGGLWVQEHQISPDDPQAWQAFDREGAFVGRLDLPAKVTLLDVGPDWVLLKTLDELDVEHVQLYGLERPTRPR